MIKNKLYTISFMLCLLFNSCFLFETKESVIEDINKDLQGMWYLKSNPRNKIHLKNGIYTEYDNDSLKIKYEYKIIISESSTFGYRLGYKYLQLYKDDERKLRYEIVETSFNTSFKTSFTVESQKKPRARFTYIRD